MPSRFEVSHTFHASLRKVIPPKIISVFLLWFHRAEATARIECHQTFIFTVCHQEVQSTTKIFFVDQNNQIFPSLIFVFLFLLTPRLAMSNEKKWKSRRKEIRTSKNSSTLMIFHYFFFVFYFEPQQWELFIVRIENFFSSSSSLFFSGRSQKTRLKRRILLENRKPWPIFCFNHWNTNFIREWKSERRRKKSSQQFFDLV